MPSDMSSAATSPPARTAGHQRYGKPAMRRPYPNIGFFFLLLFALVVAGFTPPVAGTPFFGYFSRAPHFEGVPAAIHAHAVVCVTWFVLMTTQPFLIRADRRDLHRLLGWASIVVAAAFAASAFLVTKDAYAKAIALYPRDAVLSALAQPILGASSFLLFYAIALLRRRHLHQHVAFVVAASLAVATPGLARLGLYAVGGLPGILLVIALVYATLAGFLLHAKFRLRQPVLKSPYLLILALFLAIHAMDLFGRQTAAWRWVAARIVALF